jgi:hypothetical protein
MIFSNQSYIHQHNDSVAISTKPDCIHNNGIYNTIEFKFLIFTKKREYFFCTDCLELMPIEEANKVWAIVWWKKLSIREQWRCVIKYGVGVCDKRKVLHMYMEEKGK